LKTVVHVNDKTRIAGGAEVSITQLQPLLRDRGWISEWIGVQRVGRQLSVTSENEEYAWQGTLNDFHRSPIVQLVLSNGGLFHVHSLSDPPVVRRLLSLRPVVRKMADPRMVCPGQGKFWAKSEVPCSNPFGLHCLFHTYTERCCNRHPSRAIAAYRNARFEVREASHRYAAILANSCYTREEAILAGIDARNIELLHNFTFETPPPSIDSISNRVVFAGRMARTKGVHFLLNAFQIVFDNVKEARLDLLGAGIHEQEFRQLATQLDLGESVVFHGWADRKTVDQHINGAAVVAFPSIYPEAFGISGIEAMMRGKPVVGFDVGGVKDWLHHTVTGFLVNAKDTQGFADGLIRLLQDHELNQRFGRAAREIALREFSPEPHLDRLIEIYERAIHDTRRSRL